MKTLRSSSQWVRLLVRHNIRLAKDRWPAIQTVPVAIDRLRQLTRNYGFSVALGDFLYLDDSWYVTHAGLLRLAERRRCAGIRVSQVRHFCDPIIGRWVFKAIVYKTIDSRGFVGYGDADPTNVSSLVHGAEMRVAETRAVNRALRKAYGIGLCSVEELGWAPSPSGTQQGSNMNGSSAAVNNGHINGQPRLRDRLCMLIRQHQLDANLVKAYAADYCGVSILREATRDSIEAFINDLSERAVKDREGLQCHLNSYAKHEEVFK
jgi:hypothetical protein